MKTTNYLFILIFCFIRITAEAQLSFGVRAAYVKAWMEYGDAEVPDGAIIHVHRYQVTGLVNYDLSQHLSIGLEPGFTQRGAACFPGWIAFLGDTRLLLNYFELPVMATYRFPVFKNKYEAYGKTGFGVSKALSAYRRISNAGTGNPPDKRKLDMEDSNLRQWDNGFYGGLGLARKLGNSRLFLEADYYHGLRDVDILNTSRNRSIHIGLGYTTTL
ncbi:MAG: PorT family protein [Saprospiraceae bacterium]|uniref:PorT family protein n=1 Tax=Candidatus Opimibacter skivensis TaxID=2982028 RepID=A0A9D7SVR0_9BACT|nr:PorT family protein [Candidatus Opimibacter skivensis]